MDVIYNLVHIKKFSELTYQEQLMVIHEGRPTPELSVEYMSATSGIIYKKQFDSEVYSRNSWICGCNRKDAFFCFPCVLFANDESVKLWSKIGFKQLICLDGTITQHENYKSHISNKLQLDLFGKVNVQAQLCSTYWSGIKKYNEEVTRNRYTLSKIIDCIKTCEAFDLALQGYDNSNSSAFHGLINFSEELDNALKDHLKNAAFLTGASDSIRNSILDSILDVCHEEIIREINEASFLALITDKTTNVSASFHIATIFRYVTKDGDPVERFWNFLLLTKWDSDTLCESISTSISQVLENHTTELVAQSHNSATLMARECGIQTQIKQKYTSTYSVHYYAHNFSDIIRTACSVNPQVRVFFGDIKKIVEFFNNSPHLPRLQKTVEKNMPRCAPAQLNFNINPNNVYEYRESIIECLEIFKGRSNPQSSKLTCDIQHILQDSNFTFWLTFFNYVMPHVEFLDDQIQRKIMDPVEIQKSICKFEQYMNFVRYKDGVIKQVSGVLTIPSERKRKDSNGTEPDQYEECLEICDIIINNIKERYTFINHFVAESLLFAEMFPRYDIRFPDNKLTCTCSSYTMLNKERLKTELSVLYSRDEYKKWKGIIPFLKFIISNDLEETLVETTKLLQILLTTPVRTG